MHSHFSLILRLRWATFPFVPEARSVARDCFPAASQALWVMGVHAVPEDKHFSVKKGTHPTAEKNRAA